MAERIDELLSKNGFYAAKIHGDSMYPMLRHLRDTVYIEKLCAEPQKYDAVLYRRQSGQLVLHRIVGITKNGYTMCGDGQFKKEYNVKKAQIIGILKSFYRDDKKIECTRRLYKLYVRFFCASIPTKRFLMLCYKLILKMGRCVNGKSTV